MNSDVGFIVKVLIGSAGLSIAIKQGAPYFTLAPTAGNALVSVLLPTVVMASLLGWRARQR